MPIFEYICKDCNRQFEAVVQGSSNATCPGCAGGNLEQQLSRFAVGSGSSKSAASPSAGSCGSCGDPRGPGSCSMN